MLKYKMTYVGGDGLPTLSLWSDGPSGLKTQLSYNLFMSDRRLKQVEWLIVFSFSILT